MAMITPVNLPLQEPKLGILCGLEDELKTLGGWRRHKWVVAAATGANPRRTSRAVLGMWREGCRMLLSWGVAGGLAAELEPGDLILPDGVVLPDGTVLPLASNLLPEAGAGPDEPAMLMAGSDRMVLRAADKAALLAATGAVAVDMETHLVARAAEEAAYPAIAIRAIADPAGLDLPAFLEGAVGSDGTPRIGAVLAGLAGRPAALPTLLKLRRAYRSGLDALDEAARSDTIGRLLEAVPRI
ncbi:phosphorylase [Paralimibaculum aggregatum]|uniref:Phosphorylase n=1 Tax=Paralimibaculum aggregatum TaxID=3036245 RepID=A0ABQ6LKG6_9RHOB|nr:hypothetical protein [Limibaculum sp. NKW23]GMG81278.1 phosphorylase [Limibaculum sp. NKW23]